MTEDVDVPLEFDAKVGETMGATGAIEGAQAVGPGDH